MTHSRSFLKLVITLVLAISTLTACGGGGGGAENGGTFEANNPNTKPQASSESSKASISSKSSIKSSSSSAPSPVDLTPPTVPTNFKAEKVSFDRVILTWSPSSDSSESIYYKIYRDKVQIETIHGSDNVYYDFDVSPGKPYTFNISAGDSVGNWSELAEVTVQIPAIPSNQGSSSSSSKGTSSTSSSSSSAGADTVQPTAPDQVIKVNAFSTQVDISWTAATDNVGVTSYRIYRDSALLKTVTADILSYSDKSVSSDLSYSYGVSAGDAAGNWSTQKLLSVKTPPILVTGSVTLKWLPPTERVNLAALTAAEIGGYEIRYKTIQGNNYSYKSVSNTSNQITITDLTGDYSFEIAAFDTNGLYSNFIAIKPQ